MNFNFLAAKPIVDCAAIGTTLSALIGYLPAATTVLSFVWVVIRLCETDTVKGLFKRLFKRKKRR